MDDTSQLVKAAAGCTPVGVGKNDTAAGGGAWTRNITEPSPASLGGF